MDINLYKLHELYDKHTPVLIEIDRRLSFAPMRCACGKWFLKFSLDARVPVLNFVQSKLTKAALEKILNEIIATNNEKELLDYMNYVKNDNEGNKIGVKKWLKALKSIKMSRK